MTSQSTEGSSPRKLRGQKLVDAALKELADFNSWAREGKFTWGSLAARLGVSRQALEGKETVTDAADRLRADLKKTDGGRNLAKIARRTHEQRIQQLEADKKALQEQIDRWVEKWVTVEYNCVTMNIAPDKILEPLAKPNRQSTATKK